MCVECCEWWVTAECCTCQYRTVLWMVDIEALCREKGAMSGGCSSRWSCCTGSQSLLRLLPAHQPQGQCLLSHWSFLSCWATRTW